MTAVPCRDVRGESGAVPFDGRAGRREFAIVVAVAVAGVLATLLVAFTPWYL